MDPVITFENSSESMYWKHFWTVLGSPRVVSLFPELGIPSAIAGNPVPLMNIVQEAWYQADQRLPGSPASFVEPGADAVYNQVWKAFLEAHFQKIAAAYGDDAATELYTWARRHFIDHHQDIWWYNWYLVWTQVANFPQSLVPFPLSDAVFQRRRALCEPVALEPEVNQRRGHIRALLANPESDFEKRALQMEDGGTWNLQSTLLLTLWGEHGRSIRRKVAGSLTPTERKALLEWGRDQAAARNGLYLRQNTPPADFELDQEFL